MSRLLKEKSEILVKSICIDVFLHLQLNFPMKTDSLRCATMKDIKHFAYKKVKMLFI